MPLSIGQEFAKALELCFSLLAFLATTESFKNPDVCLSIHFWINSKLQAIACNGAACLMLSFYLYSENIILLDQNFDLDNPQHRGIMLIMLHELVHYLQGHSTQVQEFHCQAMLHREWEAFRFQEQYLRQEGAWAPVSLNLMSYRCPS